MIGATHTAGLLLVGLALTGLFAALTVINRAAGRGPHQTTRAAGAGVLAWWRAGGDVAAPRQITLSAEHTLHVVEVEGRRFLVGTGPAAAPSLLSELAPAASGPEEAKTRPRRSTPALTAVGSPEVAATRCAAAEG